ncbi:hypothetical protein GX51_06536 [Blastomyces parvus]|uniref:Uncharacterized protein n=1 Tax=Blastomyces parvus TaxID=2060905 RepID=A0A2B7WQP1_9EURO|nr:hypothetical protein GX51_06536 [Blastomyces parvus]
MYANISYALLSSALIVLSAVHLILLTIHRPQPHCLPEILIFILFICVNAVVIGIGLSGLRRGDTPAFYYPLRICTAFPLALEIIRQTKIQAGPLTNALLHRLFLGYGFLSPAVKLGLILCLVAYEVSVKGTAVVVSIDYTGPVIREVTIHAFLVIITAGFAASGLFHNWPLSIQVMLIITIVEYTNGYFTAASKVILVLRAMRENAEPVLLSRMRLNQETLVEKLHSDWEKPQNKERYVPDKARQHQKISHKPNQANKHHDDETNLNQTSAVPPHLSQAINIDKESEESALCMLSLSSLMEKLKKQKGEQKQKTQVHQIAKCCSCEGISSAVNRCTCEHVYCPWIHAQYWHKHLFADQELTSGLLKMRCMTHPICTLVACTGPITAISIKSSYMFSSCLLCDQRSPVAMHHLVNHLIVRLQAAIRIAMFRPHSYSKIQTVIHRSLTGPRRRVPRLPQRSSASNSNIGKDINPTAGDGKPPLQSTLNNETRDLESYLVDEATWYSEYPDIHGDVFHGNEEVPLAFIVFISEPVLQAQLEYLKAHTSHLHFVFSAFSENRFNGPPALPYTLCLLKILQQHAGQQLSEKRLNNTIQFLSTQLRGLLSTPLLYTSRGRISHVSLLFRRQVLHKRLPRPLCLEESWKRSTVWGFTLDGNLTVTLFLDGQYRFKVPDEVWNGSSSLDSGIADVAAVFGVG